MWFSTHSFAQLLKGEDPMAVTLEQLQSDFVLLETAVKALIAEKNATPADFTAADTAVNSLTAEVNAALTPAAPAA